MCFWLLRVVVALEKLRHLWPAHFVEGHATEGIGVWVGVHKVMGPTRGPASALIALSHAL